jgi:hypothetical protein
MGGKGKQQLCGGCREFGAKLFGECSIPLSMSSCSVYGIISHDLLCHWRPDDVPNLAGFCQIGCQPKSNTKCPTREYWEHASRRLGKGMRENMDRKEWRKKNSFPNYTILTGVFLNHFYTIVS